MTTKATEQRIAERRQANDELRERLAGLDFDGPFEIHAGFDPISFLAGPSRYAICLRCGCMVRVDDPEEREGRMIERSIRVHVEWHASIDVPVT